MLQNVPYVHFGSTILQNMSYEYQGNSKLLYFRLNAYSGSGPNQRPPNAVAIFQSALGLALFRGILLLCPLQQQDIVCPLLLLLLLDLKYLHIPQYIQYTTLWRFTTLL